MLNRVRNSNLASVCHLSSWLKIYALLCFVGEKKIPFHFFQNFSTSCTLYHQKKYSGPLPTKLPYKESNSGSTYWKNFRVAFYDLPALFKPRIKSCLKPIPFISLDSNIYCLSWIVISKARFGRLIDQPKPPRIILSLIGTVLQFSFPSLPYTILFLILFFPSMKAALSSCIFLYPLIYESYL